MTVPDLAAAGGSGARGTRPVRLPGAPNFRDLGGLPTEDGRRVRPGVLFRSQALLQLDAAAWETVGRLGVRLACDLRSPAEQARHVVPWAAASLRAVSMPVLGDDRATGERVLRRIVSDPTGAAARELLLENYAAMPATFAPSLAVLLRRIVDDRELPVLVFCMEGKDRTGFVAAVLLSALGVPRDRIIEDYLGSDPFYDPTLVRRVLTESLSLSPEEAPSGVVVDALRVDRRYLERAFEVMDRDHGGVLGYLEDAGGLDASRAAALRDLVLERPAD